MELRKRILEEATAQFFKYGIRNITMDDIAAALGISKRTVYEIFRNKTELVVSCLRELSEKQEKRNKELISQSDNVIETIFAFMKDGIKVLDLINPVFFSDLTKFYPVIAETIHKENTKIRYTLTFQLLNRGVEEGIFRKDINVPIVTKLFHEQINVFSDDKMFPRNQFNRAEVFENLVINFMRGISTSTGIAIIEDIIANEF